MRPKFLKALAALTTVAAFGAITSVASAAAPSKIVYQFKRADATFAPANEKWSAVVQSSSASIAQIRKADLAYVPAVKAFDTALQKIAFTGKTARDISTLIKLNKKEISVLSKATTTKSLQAGLSPIMGQYVTLQLALSKDLGIPAAELIL